MDEQLSKEEAVKEAEAAKILWMKTLADELLNTEEAAKILGMKVTTLEVWRWNGRGPRFIKCGRSVRYRKKDLDDFISGRVFASTTEAQAGGF